MSEPVPHSGQARGTWYTCFSGCGGRTSYSLGPHLWGHLRVREVAGLATCLVAPELSWELGTWAERDWPVITFPLLVVGVVVVVVTMAMLNAVHSGSQEHIYFICEGTDP